MSFSILDTGPHRPAPEVRQAADASAVKLQQPTIPHIIAQLVGQGFADSLANVVGKSIPVDTLRNEDRADYWNNPPHITMSPEDSMYTKGTRRGILAHEYGHLLDALIPGFRQKWWAMNPNEPEPAAFGNYTGPRAKLDVETFADAFSEAISKLFPQIEAPMQYQGSHDLISARQQAAMDSLVRSRVGR